jgi:hypothetical protein
VRTPGLGFFVPATLVAAVLIIVGLGWMRARDTDFEATAIVGPMELDVNPVRVARIVSALDRGPHPTRNDDIEFTVRPAAGSRLTLVTAIGEDAEQVTLAANERAAELVDRLNTSGQGLGVFAVSTAAVVPDAPTAPPGAVSFGVMSLVALVSLAVATSGLHLSRPARPHAQERR